MALSRTFRFSYTLGEDITKGVGNRCQANWQIASFGTHGDDAGLIRSTVVEHMDQFLVEYLRVNQEACDSRPTVH